MEGGAERIFKIVAEEDFEPWPEEVISTEGKINVIKNAEDLFNAASVKSFFHSIELM